jgi:hypothetical protein
MKKYKLLITFILFGYTITNASILTKQSVELTVGSNPVSILENPSDGMIHIFCAGIDANDNNAFDEGEDERPSWWTYNPTGSSSEANKVKEFDNYFVSPFKPTIDTIKGYTTVILPFAASKTDGVFTSNGFVQGFQTKAFVSAFKVDVRNGEYLYYERQLANTISVVRVNGNDSLIVKNELNNQVDAFELDGDVIEYVTFFDEDDSQYFAPLYFNGDSSRIAVYELDKDLNVNFLFDLSGKFTDLKSDSILSYKSLGKRIYALTDSNLFVNIIEINDTKTGFKAPHNKPVEIEKVLNNFLLPLTEDIHLVSKKSKDLVVVNLNTVTDIGQIEMHHSKFEVGYMYSTVQQVYCASSTSNEKKSGRISIYDFTNEPNKDAVQIDMGYTGYQPLDFFPYGEHLNYRMYNISLGIDYNFDGIINEEDGDLPPSIWANTIKGWATLLENASLKLNFDFPINFPLNTNISSDGDITIPSGNSVHYYNVEDNEVYESFDAGMYVSTAFRVLDYLVLGQRDYANGKSYVRIKKGDFIDVSTEVGANVVDCIVYQNNSGFGVVSLSEGNFGQPDAKINIIKLSTMGIGDNTAIDVGTGGNSIVANANQTKAAIIMNGSHEIHILNLITGEIDLTFSTGTSGYGGPRDAKFYNDRLYVTTYSNQILVFDANTGEKINSILVDGNTEGLAVDKDYIITANSNYSDYSASNRVLGFKHPIISSVEETEQSNQTIRVYPHPVSNDFHLVSDDLAGTNDIAIINSQGKIVATYSGSSNGAIALNADALGLVAGNYTAVINGIRAVRFVVIK